MLDDFEQYEEGTAPDSGWVYVSKERRILSIGQVLEEGERFEVRAEEGNQYLQAYTEDQALRFTKRNGYEMEWSLDRHPTMRWRWRLHRWPVYANERESDRNDVAAAVYVTFGTDWLGRPKSIKYTYSSSLAPGTVVEQGPLKIIVVNSLREGSPSNWRTVERNVRADYRRVFGDDAPRPRSITVWSDSDSTDETSMADFDDFALEASACAR